MRIKIQYTRSRIFRKYPRTRIFSQNTRSRINWIHVLSRSEAGERPLSDEERSELLAAIGTPEAAVFATRLSREWKIIPEPALDEPDADLIWEAEQAAQRVSTLAAQPDVKHFFERRLERSSQELLASAARLTQKTYRVVFSGAIAAGKSTVICRVEGLEIPGDKAMPTNGTPTVRDAIWARPQVSSPDFRSAPYAGIAEASKTLPASSRRQISSGRRDDGKVCKEKFRKPPRPLQRPPRGPVLDDRRRQKHAGALDVRAPHRIWIIR